MALSEAPQDVALYNPTHRRYVSMRAGALARSDWTGSVQSTLSVTLSESHFVLVSAGSGMVALWSPVHSRYVGLNDGAAAVSGIDTTPNFHALVGA